MLATLALTLLLFSRVHAITVYYVAPANGTSDCPGTPGSVVCRELSYYVKQQDQYFKSGVTFRFLNGQHIFNQETVLISNVSGLTLQSNSMDYTPLMSCNGEATSGIAIVDSTDIVIENIAISNCGGPLNVLVPDYVRSRLVSVYSQNAALAVVNATNTTLNDLHITSSRYIGLLVVNGYDITVTSSMFVDNSPNMISFYTALSVCDSNAPITLSLYNSQFLRGSLGMELLQGCSYEVNVVLDSVLVNGSRDNNIDFNVSTDSTLYTLQVTNLTSMWATGVGLSIITQDNTTIAHTCCIVLPPNQTCPITIRQSTFSSNNIQHLLAGGIFLYLFRPAQTCEQSILFDSCTIDKNSGRYAGLGIIQKTNTTSITLRNCNFTENFPIQTSYTSVIATYSTAIVMEDIMIRDTPQSAILTFNSRITFRGSNNRIENNSGLYGGGIGVHESSTVHLADETTAVTFSNNLAKISGGAIYIGVSDYLSSLSTCFLEVENGVTDFQNGGFRFLNNSARFGGDIFGLSSGQCHNLPGNVFVPPLNQLSLSSSPVGVCVCNNGTPMCENSSLVMENIYPGQIVTFSLVPIGVGNKNGHAPTRGTIKVLHDGNVVEQATTSTGGCTEWMYETSTYSANFTPVVNITMTTADLGASQHDLHVSFNFTECPIGLSLTSNGTCQCQQELVNFVEGLECNSATGRFHYKGNKYWIGLVKQGDRECIGKAICSNDFCHSNTSFYFSNTDTQCRFNRSGVGCGGCADALGLMLGTNRCGKCTNDSLSLFIVFALAGIGLVALLIVLDLTVSVGTINGLIFYCNIVKICEYFFFPTGRINVLTHFISWLNLDFGFSSCFYSKFDPFAKVWLQFAFPVYIWLIVLLIIYACQKSSRLSRLLGNQTVPVLATLILLSYIKMVRIVTDAIGYTKITLLSCGADEAQYVWYNNGNIPYLASKQGALFIFGLLILFLFCIPYAMLLTCSDRSRYFLARCHCQSWWIKLKPFLDAYNSPYLDNCRFWPGLLLLLRLAVLLLLFIAGAPAIPVLVALIGGIIVLSAVLKGVYRKWYLIGLEGWSLMNVIIIAVTTLTYRESEPAKAEIGTIISVSTMLVTFVGILLFHVYLRLVSYERFRVLIIKLKARYARGKVNELLTSYSSPINSTDKSFAVALDNNDSLSSVVSSLEERNSQSGVHRRETLLLESVGDEEYLTQSSFHLMSSQ